MIMGRSIVRYSLITIAIGIAIFLVFRSKVPFGRNNTSFAVRPDVRITRIELIQGKKKVSIEESGDKWFVNKKDEARKSAVIFIMKTLREMKIKSPVSSGTFENEIVAKNVEPVRVNVFSRHRMIRSFYVYKTSSNIYGNIMKLKPSSKPFIVYMPGYEDDIGVYFIAEELFWKPYQVFHLLPSEIGSVTNEVFSEENASFRIECGLKSFQLTDLTKPVTGWDTLKVKRYLTYFTSIAFETWASGMTESEIKSITSANPLCRISVSRRDGNDIVLTVWEKWKTENGTRTPDTDRVWARTNQRDELFIMKYPELDPVLKKRSYFFN
jgi:hypothetical protein